MFFGGLLRKKSLGEIFFKNGRGPEINHRNLDGIYTETKSLKKILNKMRNSTLLCRRDLMGIALQARNLNENPKNNL